LELGPNTVLAGGEVWEGLIDSLGLRGRLLEASPRARKRFIARDGRLVCVPGNPLTTPILSFKAKLRLLCEPLIGRGDDADESLAEFVRRRCGAEFLDYIVNPVVGGIYAGVPGELSMRHAFPVLWEAEADGGSLLRGMIKRLRKKRRVRKRMVSFPNGLQELTDRLAGKLGDSLKLNASAGPLRRGCEGWLLAVGESGEWLKFDEVIDTEPLYDLARGVRGEMSRAQQDLFAQVPYAPVRALYFGFDRKGVPHPLDGFGFLVPECESKDLLGVLFSSSLFPGRAPEGKVLLTVMMGGMRNREVLDWPLERAREVALGKLRQYLGIVAKPEFGADLSNGAAIPQLRLGYGKVLAALGEFEEVNGGIHLAGSFRGGASALSCLENGVRLARRIAGGLL
jgi:oxygen-dependent protoporphyrinogen oxidase